MVGVQRLQREDEAELLMAAEVADEQAVSSQPPPAASGPATAARLLQQPLPQALSQLQPIVWLTFHYKNRE